MADRDERRRRPQRGVGPVQGLQGAHAEHPVAGHRRALRPDPLLRLPADPDPAHRQDDRGVTDEPLSISPGCARASRVRQLIALLAIALLCLTIVTVFAGAALAEGGRPIITSNGTEITTSEGMEAPAARLHTSCGGASSSRSASSPSTTSSCCASPTRSSRRSSTPTSGPSRTRGDWHGMDQLRRLGDRHPHPGVAGHRRVPHRDHLRP